MSTNELLQKPVWQMTGEEFLKLTKLQEKQPKEIKVERKEKQYVYGIRGIANLFNCSPATASRIKKSGVIDDAISQRNRTIVVDAELALKLVRENEQ